MRKILCFSLLVILVCVSSIQAQENSHWTLDSKAGSVSFSFSSTLHDVTGSIGEYKGFLNLTQESRDMDGQGVFIISSMSTGNGSRDQKMRQMFDSEHFPEIVYQFDHTMIPDAPYGQTELRGRLTIRNVTHVDPIPVTVKREDGKVVISGETEISLKAFGLKAPGVMGMIKVKDVVTVKFQLVYVRQENML